MLVSKILELKLFKDADFYFQFPDPADDFEKVPGAESSDDSIWEHLSVDVEMWTMSLKLLEDVIALNNLLHYQHHRPNKETDIHSNIVTVEQLKGGNRGGYLCLLIHVFIDLLMSVNKWRVDHLQIILTLQVLVSIYF